MNFEAPQAFWFLSLIGLLVLFSFWRLRPARVTVPSVAIWKQVPSRIPPVKAIRSPRWTVSLLLQALVVAAAVTALAGPGRSVEERQPRRLAIVVDLGARARLDLVRGELDAIRAATAGDDVVMYEVPALRRGPLRSDVAKVDYAGSPEAAFRLARAEGRRILWIGDRPAGGDIEVLTGGPSENVGIIDFSVDGEGAFVRLLNAGPERDLVVRVGDRSETWRVPAGESTRIVPGVSRVELPPDDFPADNGAFALRTDPVDVELRGRPHPLLRKALEVQPGGRLVDRGGALVVALGEWADGPAVVIDPPGGTPFEPAAVSLADHPLARGLKAGDLRIASARALGPDHEPVAFADGKTVIGVKGGTVVVSASLGDWPLTPSFPIFFANVLESARSGRPLWSVPRTGPGAPVAGGEASLLSRAASSPGRERRPFAEGLLGTAPVGPARRDLAAWTSLIALALAAAAWAWESRGTA